MPRRRAGTNRRAAPGRSPSVRGRNRRFCLRGAPPAAPRSAHRRASATSAGPNSGRRGRPKDGGLPNPPPARCRRSRDRGTPHGRSAPGGSPGSGLRTGRIRRPGRSARGRASPASRTAGSGRPGSCRTGTRRRSSPAGDRDARPERCGRRRRRASRRRRKLLCPPRPSREVRSGRGSPPGVAGPYRAAVPRGRPGRGNRLRSGPKRSTTRGRGGFAPGRRR